MSGNMRMWSFVAWLVIVAPACQAAAQELVVVVRHAERADDSADSPLSAVGEAHARRLADLLKDAGITRVFTTSLKRTIQTAAPLAAARRLTPTVLDAGDRDGVIARVRASASADRVLIVGHSNTVPDLLRALGAEGDVEVGEQYDNLFIVFPQKGAPPRLLRLRY